MTAPEERPGTDAQFGAWVEQIRGRYHADDVCLCTHTYSDHAPGPCDPPRGRCGCLRYRDAWTADDSYRERTGDAATPDLQESDE